MDQLLHQKKAMKATIRSPAFSSVAHNSWVALSIQDIEDEIFWKAMYCLLRAVFPALKVLCNYDAINPAIDKIYYHAQSPNNAILKSALDFDYLDMFGPMQVTEMTGVDLEMTKVYGEKPDIKNKYLFLHFDFR